jgi:beta-lactamase regulating signal transducer with metallopeptidase domain
MIVFLVPTVTFTAMQRQADAIAFKGGKPASTEEFIQGGEFERVEGTRVADPGTPPLTSDGITTISASLQQALRRVLPILVFAWMIGIAFFAIRLFGGFWHIRRCRTDAIFEPEPAWIHRFNDLCSRLGVRVTVELRRSEIVTVPIAVGVLKPMIIIPSSLFLQISPIELETIIAHELIHIRRLDPLVNMLQRVIESLFFFHPGVWWISAQIRREREFAADASVLEAFEGVRVIYATALASLEEIRQTTKKTKPSIATAADGGNLMQRISKILQRKTEKAGAKSAWLAGPALVLISAVITASLSFNPIPLVNAQRATGDRKLAIGFVSIPPLDRTANPPKDASATAKVLIETLKAHKIPAIGFVQGSMISDGQKPYPVRVDIVKMWRDGGFEIGVGGYKHIWFYDTAYDDYVANTEKNIGVVTPILAEKDRHLRYFSYPFLNTGKTADDRSRFESWLSGRGLTPVKYTIDNQEWMYSYAYDMARNENDVPTMTEVRIAFIKYMNDMFDHYEKYSQEMFGRDIAQTMVLTPSRLVADSAHDLFGMIEKRGYRFIRMDEALADPAFQTAEDWSGKSGISWFERWQMKQGKPLLPEPAVDGAVEAVWKARDAKK